MDSKKIGKLIAAQRKQLSMTQQNVADKLDITNKAVSKWETGEGYPDIAVLPALAEILDVTVDELLKGEKNCSPLNASSPYCIKESIQHFSNNYLLCIGITCIGIIASNLGLRLYNGYLYSSLSYSLMISLSSLIIGIMFYNNICKGLEGDIEKYNSMVNGIKVGYFKVIYKKHILFYALYLVQVVLFICVIPLYPFRNLGYYNAFKKIYGYDSNLSRYWIDYDFCNMLSLVVYFTLLLIGVLIITKKFYVRKSQQSLEEIPID